MRAFNEGNESWQDPFAPKSSDKDVESAPPSESDPMQVAEVAEVHQLQRQVKALLQSMLLLEAQAASLMRGTMRAKDDSTTTRTTTTTASIGDPQHEAEVEVRKAAFQAALNRVEEHAKHTQEAETVVPHRKHALEKRLNEMHQQGEDVIMRGLQETIDGLMAPCLHSERDGGELCFYLNDDDDESTTASAQESVLREQLKKSAEVSEQLQRLTEEMSQDMGRRRDGATANASAWWHYHAQQVLQIARRRRAAASNSESEDDDDAPQFPHTAAHRILEEENAAVAAAAAALVSSEEELQNAAGAWLRHRSAPPQQQQQQQQPANDIVAGAPSQQQQHTAADRCQAKRHHAFSSEWALVHPNALVANTPELPADFVYQVKQLVRVAHTSLDMDTLVEYFRDIGMKIMFPYELDGIEDEDDFPSYLAYVIVCEPAFLRKLDTIAAGMLEPGDKAMVVALRHYTHSCILQGPPCFTSAT